LSIVESFGMDFFLAFSLSFRALCDSAESGCVALVTRRS